RELGDMGGLRWTSTKGREIRSGIDIDDLWSIIDVDRDQFGPGLLERPLIARSHIVIAAYSADIRPPGSRPFEQLGSRAGIGYICSARSSRGSQAASRATEKIGPGRGRKVAGPADN